MYVVACHALLVDLDHPNETRNKLVHKSVCKAWQRCFFWNSACSRCPRGTMGKMQHPENYKLIAVNKCSNKPKFPAQK